MTPQEKLADLKAQVAKLEAQIANKRWMPDEGDDYYYIDEWGDVEESSSNGFACTAWKFRNLFRTREEAKKAHNLRMVRYELMDLADEAWGDMVIDWKNMSQAKYNAYFGRQGITIGYIYGAKTQGAIYFPSEESYRAAIQKIGEERFIEFVKEGL